jgi:hypothetical protein
MSYFTECFRLVIIIAAMLALWLLLSSMAQLFHDVSVRVIP